MIRTLLIKQIFVLGFSATLLGACGWMEWPPRDHKPRSSNRPATLGPAASTMKSILTVIVGEGDTVYGISRRYRVSARAIINANDLKAPYMISRGQRLAIPRARNYVVRQGDSLSSIASKYDDSFYAIARLNGIQPPYTIYVGQKLFLPNVNLSYSGKTTTKVPLQKRALKKLRAPSKKNVTSIARATTVKGFSWPVKGKVVSSYGSKSQGLQNDGINISAPRGAPVRAAENGVVAYSGNELRGFGNLLLLKHKGGWITAYAHNESLLVKRGDKIKKGQIISKVGSSGSVNKPQLHFELRKGKRAIDPIKHLPKA